MKLSKLMSAGLMTLALSTGIYSQKSEAALFIGVTALATGTLYSVSHNGDFGKAPAYIAITGGAIGALGGLTGQILKIAKITENGDQISNIFLVLDAEYPTADALSDKFQAYYPFIDDASALSELSQMVSDKYQAEDKGEGVLVHMSAEELSPVLSRMNLSAKEKATIVNDLK